MRTTWKWTLGGAFLAVAIVIAACSDASPTSPETPIPSLGVQQIGACARWSCAIADCTNDPAIYGACCVEVADDGQPTQPKPSCEGGSEYCQVHDDRCTTASPCNPQPVPSYCWVSGPPNQVPSECINVCE